MNHTLYTPGNFGRFILPKISILWSLIPLLGFIALFLVNNHPNNNQPANESLFVASTDSPTTYSFIEPGSSDNRPFMQSIRKTIQQTAEDEVLNGRVSSMSVYFESLSTGNIYTYGKGHKYSPASLLKVAVLMGYLKKSESNKSLLDQKTVYHKTKAVLNQTFLNDSLKDGHTYTNRQLIEHMIISSENDATNILVMNALQDVMDVFHEFTIETDPNITLKGDYIGITKYMLMMRTLYKSSYLSKENSEYALRLLSGSDFQHGIRSGVPPGIKVASKFGERGINGDLQLHDCAIVYLDKRPYMLGIMTKGKDFKSMSQSLKNLSSQIYEVINAELKVVKN